MLYDDIVAIATPPGEGGIAIIRLSGNNVIDKVQKVFKPFRKQIRLDERPSHTLTLGWITDEQGELIDEVLVSIMRSPHSYTTEDVVEINCHGGTLPARQILRRMMGLEIRLAEPGEFTRRAYLNGRLDISQAEAVIELIRAKSDQARRLALRQLDGYNSRQIKQLEDQLIHINALVEASLDFPDDVGEPDYPAVEEQLTNILEQIEQIIAAGKRAEIYREGIKVVICGKPNVGKSSLLNALLRKEKAIVTDIPGTTRDVIEDYLNIKGIPVKLMDTAGIRTTHDLVERIGVDRSREVISEADLVIFLVDFESGITEEDLEIFHGIENRHIIILVNKEDLEEKNISEEELLQYFPGVKVIRGSVKEDIGLQELENSIESMVLSENLNADDMEIMLNLRQIAVLEKANQHLQDARHNLTTIPLDCLAVDVWGALESLGEISGKNLKEEVLDRIFSEFCIGK
ncbi:MAG: tRNA uridine-5-carboxymethylaminomethyl(34) synthesis GTPase MnmE [Syntrophomonadaceae bacterium]|nr:tRNA uridine-5-carboxymethylaminomethyl(34) synthesis GTPase MnmE [Syntrophomonadaceae bacterium]